MTEIDTFLSQILDQPADDTPRLVFADWLREHPDPAHQRRGAFLWAGVVASKYRNVGVIEDGEYFAALKEMNAAAVGIPFWLQAVGLPVKFAEYRWEHKCDEVTATYSNTGQVYFSRGMLSALVVPFEETFSAAARVLATCPLERVGTSDRPGFRFDIIRTPSGWILEGTFRSVARLLRSNRVEPPESWKMSMFTHTRAELIEQFEKGARLIASDIRTMAGDRWIVPR